MEIPEVSYETKYSLELWEHVKGQVRIPPLGGNPYALDTGAVVTTLKGIGVTDVESQLQKMQIIFDVLYGEK